MDEYQRRFGELTTEQALYRVLVGLQLEDKTAFLQGASRALKFGLGDDMARGIVVSNTQVDAIQIRELLGDRSRGNDGSTADIISGAITAISEKTGQDYSALAAMIGKKIDLEAITELPVGYRSIVQDLLAIQEANRDALISEIDIAILSHFT